MFANVNRLAAGRFVQAALLAIVLALPSSQGRTEDWQAYRFGDVSIEAPSGWQVTYRQSGREVHLAGPDGVYSLLAFWWLPDEPLLGYADIVAHEEFTLAGRRAMLITSDFPQRGVYGLAFLDPRADGHQFVMNLEFEDKDFAKAAVLLDELLERLRYADKRGGASRRFGQGVAKSPAVSPAPAAALEPQAGPDYVPVGDIQVAAIDNKGAVRNGPTKPVVINTLEPIFIRSIQTYHWNNGRGQKPATVSIRSATGEVFGPWQAVGKPGQGGVRNAYWRVEPGVVLPAGKYELIDSSPKTWATNDAAGNKGFVVIEFQKVEKSSVADGAVSASPSPPAASGPPASQPAAIGPGGAPAGPSTAEPAENLLFGGAMDDRWRPVSVAGGNFDAFATFADGMLKVDVPAGNAWGKTGIRSAQPLVVLDKAGPAKILRFVLVPEATTSFALSIAARDQEDEWSAHEVRFLWSRNADGLAGTATLHLRRTVVRQIRTGAEAPEEVRFRVDPSGAVAVILPDGTWLEARVPDAIASGGYYVHAVAHAPEADKAARLALKRIEIEEAPAKAGATAPYPDQRQEIVLFDGRLGTAWTPHSAGGGDFNRDARLDGHELVVDVPEGSAWGSAGILSADPLVWLDSFRGDAEVDVTFAIDPDRTDGFVLALAHSGYGGVAGNPPGTPNVSFSWYRSRDGAGAAAQVDFNPHNAGDFDRQEVAARAPSEVRFTVRPGTVTVSAEGMAPVTRAFPVAADGAGLRLYAYSAVAEQNAPTRFALRSIRMHRTPGPDAAAPDPAPGVAPLPFAAIFAGVADPRWEPIGVAGGNFDSFARYADGALVVDVPAGNSWGKTGLLSAEPIVTLDSRVRIAPARIGLQLDPAIPQNLNVALSGRKLADMWLDHQAWYTLSYVAERQIWVMGIRSSPYHDWSREIDPAWMAAHWDGRVSIDVGDGWTTIDLPGGPRLYATAPVAVGNSLFAVVEAHAPGDGKAAALTLKSIRAGLATPAGMTEIDRLALVDDDAFDPDAFADALVAAVSGDRK